jgi:ceramide glucosyltransferase
MLHALTAMVGVGTLGVAAAYGTLAFIAVIHWRLRRLPTHASGRPPITVLKPLCGEEPHLYENLRSFCEQDYQEFQIVFGVGDPTDLALGVAERIRREFPSMQIDVVVSSRSHGSNRKVSNLINMLELARHDLLVLADSDTFVRPDYLATVTTPLLDPSVGLVTCIYRDMPVHQVWSRLGAMYVNEWYMPSVLLGWLLGHNGYVSGQTICIRRDTLEAVGGLPMVGSHLADDYKLGELVRSRGQRVVLSDYLLRTRHYEPSLAFLSRHELRWMRTLQVLRPRSFRWLFLTFSLPLALLGAALSAGESTLVMPARVLFLIAVVTRVAIHLGHRVGEKSPWLRDLWLMPARDLLIFWIWCRAFFTSRLTWRGSEFDIDADGVMRKPS